MKEMYGQPQFFIENFKATMGHDWLFWLIPTRPCLKINYLEKVYKLKEIEKMKTFDEDDYDENKKIYANEVLKSKLEKQLMGVLITGFVGIWYMYLNDEMQNYWLSWTLNKINI